jgi:hypothetical protein
VWSTLAITGILLLVVYQYLNVRAVEGIVNFVIRLVGQDLAEPFAKVLLARHITGTVILFFSAVAVFWMIEDKSNEEEVREEAL